MFKKILLLLLLFSFTVSAQDTIRGKMTPVKNYSYIILNQLNSVNKKYIANAVITNGEFELVIPKDTEPGMYRLDYDVNKNLYIDILYNKEEIDFEFHPEYPSILVKFNKSEENKLYQSYFDEVSVIENKLDSIQVDFFSKANVKEKTLNKEKVLNKLYSKELVKLKAAQKLYNKKAEGKLVSHFITASKRHYNETLIKDTNEYLNSLKFHYYDNIDFDNKTLAKSSILIDKVMDYILYLTNSKDNKELITLRKKAVTETLDKIKPDVLRRDIIHSLLYMFAQNEVKEITDYIFKNHFSKLPLGLQDFEFKDIINDMFKTTIGQQAPNIEWDVYGKEYSLATLEKSEYYVVVFWGSTCPHCMVELPKYNGFLIDKKNIKTIAVGVENDDSKASWKEETFNLENMMHVLALGKDGNKWNNKIVKDYGVTSTPSYYILDSNKVIIAKPYDFKEIKEYFEKIE